MAHIKEFYEYVNLSHTELSKWLDTKESKDAGFSDNGEETKGHQSGKKIVEILKKHAKPAKEDQYEEEEIQWMAKVVAYCKRHLAQEQAGNDKKSEEDLKKTKSYRSLKNWGHDSLKSRNDKKRKETDSEEPATTSKTPKRSESAGKKGESQKSPHKQHADHATTRSESKKTEEAESASEKKPKTPAKKTTAKEEGDDKKPESAGKDKAANHKTPAKEKSDSEKKTPAKKETAAKDKTPAKEKSSPKEKRSEETTDDAPSKGDDVSWSWGGGNPHGKVLDVKGSEASITTKNGNTVSRKGTSDDPAVILDAGKSKAIKLNHELN